MAGGGYWADRRKQFQDQNNVLAPTCRPDIRRWEDVTFNWSVCALSSMAQLVAPQSERPSVCLIPVSGPLAGVHTRGN